MLVLIVAQAHLFRCKPPTFVGHCGIVALRCIYIFMSENIGNKINISCFFIKGGTVGTSKLMRSYFYGK